MNLLLKLEKIISSEDLTSIKKNIQKIYDEVENYSQPIINYKVNGSIESIKKELLEKELGQILDAKTKERTNYYLTRLIKSLSVQKKNKINDLNLNRWKEYDDLITDSLWIFDKRDTSGVHKAGYWGNFIPQIPNQLLRRFTKKGEWVLDPFLGSGTTLIECKRLGRNGVGIELNSDVAESSIKIISKEKNHNNVTTKVINADSSKLNFSTTLKVLQINSFQFAILHPPYWDIIKFSKSENDLSNANTIQSFLKMFSDISAKIYSVLDKKRYCGVVIGDKYDSGEWIPLSFYVMQEMIKNGFKLKSTIIKNFDQTTAKRNQKELWRYRALAGGFYIFKHEYIFLFQK